MEPPTNDLEVKIVVETHFPPLAFDIQNGVPDGVTVHVPPVIRHRSLDIDTVITIVVTIYLEKGLSVLNEKILPTFYEERLKPSLRWLGEKVKGKPKTKVEIDNRETLPDEHEMLRVILEKIEAKPDRNVEKSDINKSDMKG